MFDSQTIDIPCENCNRNTPKSIRWLKSNKKFTCSCGTIINLDSSDFIRQIKDIEKSIDDFGKNF